MAVIKPFRAIRPAKNLASRVAALPYDVFNRQEAAVEAAKDRLSFLNIDRPETQFEEGHDIYAPDVYQKARQLLDEQIDSGIYVQDEKTCYYLYELTMNGRSQTGLVACASIDDYLENVIKKHENTRADKEADRIRHVDVCSAQTGPIFLTYRKNEQISETAARVKEKEAMFDFVASDGIRHRGWCIGDEQDIQIIRDAFDGIGQIYIADGHHRAASAVKAGLKRRTEHPGYNGDEEFNFFLSVLFPDDELMIMDYDRIVKDLNGLSEEAFLEKVKEKYEVTPVPNQCRPEKKGCMGMYLNGHWYHLETRKPYLKSDPVRGLDVSVLYEELLAPVLGIGDMKEDRRLDFVGGIRGLGELERRADTDFKLAFSMYPTSIAELFAVADAGMLMPPKSTWFEPKLRSGLFIHRIED